MMNFTLYSLYIASSFHFLNTLTAECFSQLFNVHVCAANHKLEHSAYIDLLLAFLLKFVRDLVFRYYLSGLRAKSLTHFLKFFHVNLAWVSKESNDEVRGQENDALLLVLKLFSELREGANI